MIPGTNGRVFHYHADASPFGGIIFDESGVGETITTQGSASLSESGGKAEGSGSFAHPNVSVTLAASRIDGSQATASPNDWVTTVTTSVECLNIADRVTADEIACTMITQHPSSASAYYPSIEFKDCTYKNLRVDGQLVTPKVCTDTYARNAAQVKAAPGSWMQDIDLLKKVTTQMSVFSDSSVPSSLNSRYNWVACANDRHAKGHVVCSLVQGFTGGLGSIQSYGHVLVVPGFGTLFFGELRVYQCSFSVTMLRVEIDAPLPPPKKKGICKGTLGFVSARTNASSSP